MRKIILISFLIISSYMHAQVILQGFYWDVPVNDQAKEGIWYNNLNSKLDYLKQIGITGIWSPPPSKGNWGIYDMGYGIYDHYDLGEYSQIKTVSTRFGTREQLDNFIQNAHQRNIEVYADVVLNHLYSFQDKDLEVNPIIKNYILNRSKKWAGYPINELRFVVDLKPNQSIVIHLKNTADVRRRSGYRLKVSDDPSMTNANKIFHPILSKNNPFGYWEGMVDREEEIQFLINRNPAMKLWLQLEVLGKDMSWGDQTNGLTISSITDEKGQELNWEVYSYTGINPISGRMNWNFRDFHPSHMKDYIVNYPDTGGIVANSKLFGHDFDHQSKNVQKQLKDWGKWLLDDVKYDGVRLDFVNGIEANFIHDWTNAIVPDSGFCVTEFFTYSINQIAEWNKEINKENNTNVRSFDFPLKKLLTDMCNDTTGKFDMTQLVNAGLISQLPADRIITFAENHDTGKEHDKWITKDWEMAYAYILFHQPTPCLFYSHLFHVVQTDFNTKEKIIQADVSLPDVIEKLIKVRSGLQGATIVDTTNINKNQYIVYRKGVKDYGGAILILNRNDGNDLTIDLSSLVKISEGEVYVNVLNPDEKVSSEYQKLKFKQVERGASVWMRVQDYEKIVKLVK